MGLSASRDAVEKRKQPCTCLESNFDSYSVHPVAQSLFFKIFNVLNSIVFTSTLQKIFQMNRMEGKKYNEIARELNISVKTVEAEISKVLKELRHKYHSIYN